MLNTLESLFNLARERKKTPVDGSYTNKLLSDKSLSKEKILEEINELIEAVDQNSNKIHEAADVFYHLIMYLEANDIKIEETDLESEYSDDTYLKHIENKASGNRVVIQLGKHIHKAAVEPAF